MSFYPRRVFFVFLRKFFVQGLLLGSFLMVQAQVEYTSADAEYYSSSSSTSDIMTKIKGSFSVATVQAAGSDIESKTFQEYYLPTLQKVFETGSYADYNLKAVDPVDLGMAGRDVRFYSVGTQQSSGTTLTFDVAKGDYLRGNGWDGAYYEGVSGSDATPLLSAGEFIDFSGVADATRGFLGTELTVENRKGQTATTSLFTGDLSKYTSGDYKLFQIGDTDYYYGKLNTTSTNRVSFAFHKKKPVTSPEPKIWVSLLVLGVCLYIFRERLGVCV